MSLPTPPPRYDPQDARETRRQLEQRLARLESLVGALGGLSVATPITATTLGDVQGAIEVFGQDGTSLGFLALYASAT